MCMASPTAAEISATIRNVIPAQSKLPVKKKTAMAAKAAMGKAKRTPMKMMAINAIISRTITSHQNCGSFIGMFICAKNNQNHLIITSFNHRYKHIERAIGWKSESGGNCRNSIGLLLSFCVVVF